MPSPSTSSKPSKTVIITGANAGIGFVTAKYIAARPDWCVVLACRNLSKANAARDQIRQAIPTAAVEAVLLDLFSLASVRSFVSTLTTLGLPPIHGLVLNAGGINMNAKTLEFTEDGFERTFQLNFLGHFVLTNLIVKDMCAPSRIVFVMSDLHDPAATMMGKFAPPRYGSVADLAYGKDRFASMQPMARYGTAKMYTMMMAYELDRRLHATGTPGITVNGWSPGVVPTTQAGRDMPAMMKKVMMSPAFVKLMGSHLATDGEVAQALGSLMIDPKYDGVSGKYFDGFREIPSSVESRDTTKASTVWTQAVALAKLSDTDIKLRSSVQA